MEIINNENTTGTGYADDLILMASGYKTSTTTLKIQKVLDKLSEWGKTHGLKFNADKTIAVFFTKSKTENPCNPIYVHGRRTNQIRKLLQVFRCNHRQHALLENA